MRVRDAEIRQRVLLRATKEPYSEGDGAEAMLKRSESEEAAWKQGRERVPASSKRAESLGRAHTCIYVHTIAYMCIYVSTAGSRRRRRRRRSARSWPGVRVNTFGDWPAPARCSKQ